MTRIVQIFPAGALLLILGLGLVACGRAVGASGHATGFSNDETAQIVEVRVDPGGQLAWEQSAYTAVAGDVTFVVSSPHGLAHNFVVEGPGIHAQSQSFAGGTTNRFTLKGLPAGAYRIACTIPGHREGGMVATLSVR